MKEIKKKSGKTFCKGISCDLLTGYCTMQLSGIHCQLGLFVSQYFCLVVSVSQPSLLPDGIRCTGVTQRKQILQNQTQYYFENLQNIGYFLCKRMDKTYNVQSVVASDRYYFFFV